MSQIATTRNQNQDTAMTLIYNALLYFEMEVPFDVEGSISNYLEIDYQEAPLFIKEVIIKALSHLNEIRGQIQNKLIDWRFDRLNKIAQAILILAYTHFVYVGNVDKKVIIDIAVRQAKRYLAENEYKFINAVLDNLL